MSLGNGPEHIQDIASTMKGVEKAQSERIHGDAGLIFNEADFLKKIQKKQQDFASFLKNAKLSTEKERAFLQSPEVKDLLVTMEKMKKLKEKKENLQRLGKEIEKKLLTLFDTYTKLPEVKKQAINTSSELRMKVKNFLSSTTFLLPKETIATNPKAVGELYKKILSHQQTSKAALDTWNNRKMVPMSRGLSAGDTLAESEAVQLKEAYKILKSLHPSSELYEGMKYMQRDYPKVWLQQSIAVQKKALDLLLKAEPLDEKKVNALAQKIQGFVTEFQNFEKNPKKLPNSYAAVFPEVKNRLYSDDVGVLKDTMKNIPKGILLGIKETVVSTVELAWTFGKDLVKLPSVIGYATAHYHGDTNAVLKEMAADNVYGKMLKGFVDISSYVAKDPGKAEKQLVSILKNTPQYLGKWWDALSPEEKGVAIGKILSNLLPAGAALKFVPKASKLITESAALKRVSDVLHTSFFLKNPPVKWDGKSILKALSSIPAIKTVGPGYIEKNIYTKIKQQFPKDHAQFFEQKTGMLNAEFVASPKGRKILEDAGFRFAGMIDVGGVGTENAIFGSAATDKRFQYIKQIAQEAEKRGVLPCRVGGDEFLFFSHDEKIFKNIQGKMDTYQKGLHKPTVDIAHGSEKYKSEAKKTLGEIEKKVGKKVTAEMIEKDYIGAQKKTFEEIAHVVAHDKVSDVASFQKAFPKKKFTSLELDKIRALQILAKNNAGEVARELKMNIHEAEQLGKTFEDLAVYIFLKQKASKAPKSNFGVMYTVYDKLEIKELDKLVGQLEDGISLRKKAEKTQKKTYMKLTPSKLEKFLGKAKDTLIKKEKGTGNSPTLTDTGSLKIPGESAIKIEKNVIKKKIETTAHLKLHDRVDLGKPVEKLLSKDTPYAVAIGWESNIGAYNNMTKFGASGSGTAISNELIALSREVTHVASEALAKNGSKVEVHLMNEGGTFALYITPKPGSKVSSSDAKKIAERICATANEAQKNYLKQLTLAEGKNSHKAALDKITSTLSKAFAKMSVGQKAPLAIDAFQHITKPKVLNVHSKDNLKHILFNL